MQPNLKPQPAMPSTFATIDDLDVKGKTVLVRMDLNVPMQGGKVTDYTRILRLLPTLKDLIARDAKIVILSHFDRPNGKFVPSMSLASMVDPLSEILGGHPVQFGVDCVGPAAREAVSQLKPGDVLLLENLRFHAEEEMNDPNFAAALASLADIYLNDAFSCAHRAHASTAGVAKLLPHAAGRLMQEELETLSGLFNAPARPMAAVVGGSKVSTKLALLENLLDKVNVLIIGGAMANTFLLAQGHGVGASLHEADLKATAGHILAKAKQLGCDLVLPVDVVVSTALEPQASCHIVPVSAIPSNMMALDIGPETVALFQSKLKECRTALWNGPMGAFEVSPFDIGTVSVARMVASQTGQGTLKSVAGGGDTVSALCHAGLSERFSYLSTAGGAFLEWVEGKELPGVAALIKP